MGIVEKYLLVSKIGYVAAIVFLILAIVLFFVFRIKKIICDLTGITERKAISAIREETLAMKDKDSKRLDDTNSGPITDKISTNRLRNRYSNMEATVLQPGAHPNSQETTLLQQNETTLLQQNETTLLQQNETTVLPQFGATEELSQSMQPAYAEGSNVVMNGSFRFAVIESIVITHSDIVI